MSYPSGQKPPQWSIDSGIVAYNASRLGLPMPVLLLPLWKSYHDLINFPNITEGADAGDSLSWQGDRLYFGSSTNNAWLVIPDWQDSPLGQKELTVFIKGEFSDQADNNCIMSRQALAWQIVLFATQAVRYYSSAGHHDGALTAIDSTGTFAVDEDISITVTRNDTGDVSFYFNGVFDSSGNIGGNFADVGAEGQVCVGARYDGSTQEIDNSYLDTIICFDKCLNVAQVQNLHNNSHGLIADPYQIETLAYVAAAGGLSIPNPLHRPLAGPLGGPL